MLTALLGVFGLAASATLALAQAPPPPGLPPAIRAQPLGERPEDRLRDIQRQQFRRDGGAGAPVAIPGRPAPGDTSAATLRFNIRRIEISPSAVLPQGQLRALASRLEGREVVLEDLNRLVRDITALYPAAGFPVGFAILPPQKVENGIVQIVLIEPRVDDVRVGPTGYTDHEYLRSRVPLKSGDLVDVFALERALLVMARTSVSGIRVAARLVPGSDFATSTIVLDVIEPPRHTIASTTDNYGTEDNGEVRNQTLYRNTSLMGRDDPLAVGVSFSRGAKSTFGIYDTPIGIQGTRLEFQYSLSESRVVAGPFEDLDLRSDGQFASLQLRHPFLVDTNWLAYGLAEIAFSNGRTLTGPLEVGTNIGRTALGARITRFDDDGTIELTNKAVFIGARAHDDIGDQYDSYFKYMGDLRAIRSFGWLTAIGEVAWQLTPDDLLPSAEQFAFGGPSTVRAYEINQFSGDRGYWGRLELHGPGFAVADMIQRDALGARFNVFVFTETAGAFPFRATGPKIEREDFGSDAGVGLDLGMFDGRLNGRVAVAKSFDKIHEPLLSGDPKVLMELNVKLEF